ncbi:hypothetical protein PENSPDRAFT_731174 [Peniophora sp. CONT]|nr:hypothetical protein PENSPDRAFT_731174 [Peniophora sp. CONT]
MSEQSVDDGKVPCVRCGKRLSPKHCKVHERKQTCVPVQLQPTQPAATTIPSPSSSSTSAASVSVVAPSSTHVKRTMNEWMQYRKLASSLVKSLKPPALKRIQPDLLYMEYRNRSNSSTYYKEFNGLVSRIVSEAWATESESVQRNLRCIAAIDSIIFKEENPGYKYEPKKKGKEGATQPAASSSSATAHSSQPPPLSSPEVQDSIASNVTDDSQGSEPEEPAQTYGYNVAYTRDLASFGSHHNASDYAATFSELPCDLPLPPHIQHEMLHSPSKDEGPSTASGTTSMPSLTSPPGFVTNNALAHRTANSFSAPSSRNVVPALIQHGHNGVYDQTPLNASIAANISDAPYLDTFILRQGGPSHAPTHFQASSFGMPPPPLRPHPSLSAGQMATTVGAHYAHTPASYHGTINNQAERNVSYGAPLQYAAPRPEYLNHAHALAMNHTLHTAPQQRNLGYSAYASAPIAGYPYHDGAFARPQSWYPSLPSNQSTPPSESKVFEPLYPQDSVPAPAADSFAPQRTSEQFVAPASPSEEQVALLEATSYENVMRLKSQHVSMEDVILPAPAPTLNRPSPLQSTFASPFSASPTPFVQTPPEQLGNGQQQPAGPAPSAYAGHGKRGREEEIKQSYPVGHNKRGRWDAPEYGYGYNGSFYQPGPSSFGGPF